MTKWDVFVTQCSYRHSRYLKHVYCNARKKWHSTENRWQNQSQPFLRESG